MTRLLSLQGKSFFFGFDAAFSKYQDFRNDREKRDFVACGSAAGNRTISSPPLVFDQFILVHVGLE
jgi:hypothetical protein